MNQIQEMYQSLGISEKIYQLSEEVLASLSDIFEETDQIAEYNQMKVLYALQKNKVSEACFHTSTGYGYNDLGRDTLEKVYADIFHTEDALVRPQITCGTHALGIALAANLRPGDTMMYVSGKPYDTLEEVIGIRPSKGSLKEYGINYKEVDLLENGEFDIEGIKNALTDDVKLIGIQRSKGYATRPSLLVEKIGQVIKEVKAIRPDVIVMVDNCYGEFVETKEPSDYGADMIVGSLIKNAGGGLAPAGGYICGTKACVEQCAYRLTTPGLGKEVGANMGVINTFYQGLFLAPTVVAGAKKGAVFAAALFEKLNYKVVPTAWEPRTDIIQCIEFGNPDAVVAFCKGIQAAAPVDSYVSPEPWDMPGYDAPVIMAAGAFVQGSSIELSADGPIKPPYAVYFQGGLTWHHAKLGILKALASMEEAKIVEL
ncbi:MAG: methionine gamma-lyase family protein [Eubacterium sp.]|nr:methionine gamma-lyase family protein [Eubacterium sp.]